MCKNCIVVIHPFFKSRRDDLLFCRETRSDILKIEDEPVCIRFISAETNLSSKGSFAGKKVSAIIFEGLNPFEIKTIIESIIAAHKVGKIFSSLKEFKEAKKIAS